MTAIDGHTVTIDHQSRCERTWGISIDHDHYQADVLVVPLANTEPPEWMKFTFRPVPPGVQIVDWFMVGASPHVGQYACELVSAKITPISFDAYQALDARHQPVIETPEPVGSEQLAAADFAGPNRQQRRAQRPQRPRRRR